MKIVLLSAASCIHTTRWANALVSRGNEVTLISVHPLTHDLDSRVTFYRLKFKAPLGYLLNLLVLKRILRAIEPSILNVHFATGYGLMAALSNFKPCMLSVWGSDVYDFPSKSVLHSLLLRFNLKSATSIASTSNCMAMQTAKYFRHEHIYVTPFGVDIGLFQPKKCLVGSEITIGTVKTLRHVYGIDTLICAFAALLKRVNNLFKLKLEIWGSGPDLKKLQKLAFDLNIDEYVFFKGAVSHDLVPDVLNGLDIYAALSRHESFGVAILEAAACAKPVVVSDADGPAEIVVDGVTGFVVPRDSPNEAAEALYKLVVSEALRLDMGRHARAHVVERYSWDYSVDLMLSSYENTIKIK